MSDDLRCSPEFRPTLATLAAADESLSVLRARLAALPERQELSRLEQLEIKRDKRMLERFQQNRGHQQMINRLRQDVGKLKERVRANKKALSAEVDREKRKDLKHDLSAAQVRLQNAEERLATELKTAGLFSDETKVDALGEAADEELKTVAAKIQLAREKVAQASRAIEADISAAEARAEAARNHICDSVLEAYDKQRAAHGVGAANLQGRTCQGCFMELDPAFMKQLRSAAADEVMRCPECEVLILV